MFFALPWMLLGLLGLPALAAIYWLRSRAKLRTVSSLFLWIDQRRPRQGGRIFQRLQTPLTFFLELLAIAAIAIAAAAPASPVSQYARPLVIWCWMIPTRCRPAATIRRASAPAENWPTSSAGPITSPA